MNEWLNSIMLAPSSNVMFEEVGQLTRVDESQICSQTSALREVSDWDWMNHDHAMMYCIIMELWKNPSCSARTIRNITTVIKLKACRDQAKTSGKNISKTPLHWHVIAVDMFASLYSSICFSFSAPTVPHSVNTHMHTHTHTLLP